MSTVQAQKLELLEWLAALKDEQVLAELVKWKEEHQRVSIEQYNQELEEANMSIEAGDYISHEAMVKDSGSWLK